MRRAVVLVFLAMILSACSDPLEFPEWTIPVLDGTPIVEYAAVPSAERGGVVELVGEMVFGEQSEDVEAVFYQPVGLAADRSGRVFILDLGSHQVKAFSPDGVHVGNFGREGQGPGEFQFPRSISMAGGEIVVNDMTRARLIRWSPEGELLGESALEFTRSFNPLIGQHDGSLVAGFDVRADDWPLISGFGHVSGKGELVTEYFELRAQVPMYRHARGWQALRLPGNRPSVAATPSGEVYVTRGDKYQLLALTVDGTQRWALRVASPREPYDEVAVNEAIANYADMLPEMTRDNIDLPPALPTLSRIVVDGHGHLYAFLYAEDEGGEQSVDVYTADGERIFSGLIRTDLSRFPGLAGGAMWRAAIEDSVYAFATSAATDEAVAVRYRLVEPFE